MTGSGFYDTPSGLSPDSDDGLATGEFSITDMVNRLEPSTFRWIDSSLAEQEFLGYSLGELKKRSFLDACSRGRKGLRGGGTSPGAGQGRNPRCAWFACRRRQGKTRAVELNAGARYNADHQVSYLRCHLTDVTEKVRAERRLRLRTRELIRVNEQLRQINRELEELKNRYSDLYQNAPAMYFSLDGDGRLVECNQTFLITLGRDRDDVLGQGLERFVLASEVAHCHALIAQLMEKGNVESESRWEKSSGEPIDVLVSGKMTRGPRGEVLQVRCVAQDISAKKRLEAELRDDEPVAPARQCGALGQEPRTRRVRLRGVS